jgi:hypothetical protein
MSDVTPDANKVFTFAGSGVGDEILYEHFTPEGTTPLDNAKKLAFLPGRAYSLAEIDRHFPAAVISSITPATGPAAGGTTVTIKGQNFTGTTAVNFGGTPGTSLTIVSENELTVVTPAKTAGAHSVAVVGDDGTTTVADGFLYV